MKPDPSLQIKMESWAANSRRRANNDLLVAGKPPTTRLATEVSKTHRASGDLFHLLVTAALLNRRRSV